MLHWFHLRSWSRLTPPLIIFLRLILLWILLMSWLFGARLTVLRLRIWIDGELKLLLTRDKALLLMLSMRTRSPTTHGWMRTIRIFVRAIA